MIVLILMFVALAFAAYGASAQSFDTHYSEGKLVSMPMGAEKIYQGTLVDVDASGYVVQVADTDGLFFAGVAAETVDNSGGTQGDLNIRVWMSGVFTFKIAAAQQDDVGKLAFTQLGSADAGQTVKEATDGTNPLAVGRITEYISATRVRVRIDGYALTAGATPNGIHT